MEYVSGGELFDYIVQKRRLREDEARQFLREMISALDYTHGNLVAHRDLKLENVLLSEDGHIKIADFGFSGKGRDNKTLFFGFSFLISTFFFSSSPW
jgi:serine/threonine protein kinase